VASVLLRRLAQHAATQGISIFVAEVLSANRSMVDVFAHSGAVTSSDMDCGVIRLTMAVDRLIASPRG
jgi:hypothetical protein